jgi:phosphatidylethanolamine-binding protein (PEBP) family uncharacterized protein
MAKYRLVTNFSSINSRKDVVPEFALSIFVLLVADRDAIRLYFKHISWTDIMILAKK